MARDIVKTDAYAASRRARKKVEMLFAHLKRILGPTRLRHRGPNGARDEFLMAATVQNLRKMALRLPVPAWGRTRRKSTAPSAALTQRVSPRHRPGCG
jgi:hypothetical protein